MSACACVCVRVHVCVCACVRACVLHGEGNRMLASRALVVASVDGSVSDRLQWLTDRFP